MLKCLPFLFLLFSCSTGRSLSSIPFNDALKSIKVTGEGRGRLSLEQGQHVFSYEALLKDEKDWILAVAVPLHGEEVMVLQDLRQAGPSGGSADDFEVRLKKEVGARLSGADLTGEDYIRELRSLIRFVLAGELGLSRACEEAAQGFRQCGVGDDVFMVEVLEDKVRVHKSILKKYLLTLTAENLTDSFFTRTSFDLHSQKDVDGEDSQLTLELFWK